MVKIQVLVTSGNRKLWLLLTYAVMIKSWNFIPEKIKQIFQAIICNTHVVS